MSIHNDIYMPQVMTVQNVHHKLSLKLPSRWRLDATDVNSSLLLGDYRLISNLSFISNVLVLDVGLSQQLSSLSVLICFLPDLVNSVYHKSRFYSPNIEQILVICRGTRHDDSYQIYLNTSRSIARPTRKHKMLTQCCCGVEQPNSAVGLGPASILAQRILR